MCTVMQRGKAASAALICAVALFAMVTGHAAVAALGAAAGYRHVVQAPMLGIAALLSVGVAIALVRKLAALVRPRPTDGDWALPAFSSVTALGPGRVTATVLVLQTIALFAGESIEQRAAGVTLAGVAGLFGSSLAIAPFVHLTIGLVAGLGLWFAARAVCASVGSALSLVRRAVAWLSPVEQRSAARIFVSRDRTVIRPLLPLAHKIASRPPPSFSIHLV